MTVYLVRHGDAGDRERWQGDDASRPLSGRGRREAQALVRLLDGRPVERVLSSPAVRCRQTVESLAEARRLAVEDDENLAEGTPGQRALAHLCALEVPTAACSHGDVIGEIVGGLARHGVVGPAGARWAKGSVWVLDVEAGRVHRASYLAPAGTGR